MDGIGESRERTARLERALDRCLELAFALRPSLAQTMGWPDPEFPELCFQSLGEKASAVHDLAAELSALATEPLTPSDRADHCSATAIADQFAFDLAADGAYATNPSFYLGEVTNVLIARLLNCSRLGSDGKVDREKAREYLEGIRAAIAAIPRMLDLARREVTRVSRHGAADAQSLAGYAARLLPQLASTGKDLVSMESDVQGALQAIEEFRRHVEQNLLPDAGEWIGSSPEAYQAMLRVRCPGLKAWAPADLQRQVQAELEQTRIAASEVGRTLFPGDGWPELVRRVVHDHTVRLEEGLTFFRQESDFAAALIRARALLAIPEGLPVFEQTPSLYEPFVPDTGFNFTPVLSRGEQKGYVWLTADRDGMLRLSSFMRSCACVHEGYPGHYVQHVATNQAERLFQRVPFSTAFSEGWALYAEEMMERAGFFDTPQAKLGYLIWRFVRLVHVSVDLQIGMGKHMDEAQSAQFAQSTGAELEWVKLGVRQCVVRPGSAVGPYLMNRQITDLKAQAATQWGDRFSLQAFHTALLGRYAPGYDCLRPVLFQ